MLTNFPFGISSFGVPVVSNPGNPIFGKFWFVDGNNGSDGNDGLSVEGAFKTIQKAITIQIAFSSGFGDVIYILPGTYAESLTGNLTKVSLIGVGANQVIVAPTASNAYAGVITDSLIKGIQFRTPSTSNLTYAALAAQDLLGSRITECIFAGTTDPANAGVGTVGIRIGAETDTTWEMMVNSSIDHCIFKENAGRSTELSYCIVFGNTDDTDNNATRIFRHSMISDNQMCAEFGGIKLNTGNANNNGGVITRNFIHSIQGGEGGCQEFGIKQMVEEDVLCMVTDNRIVVAAGDAIENMNANNVQGNLISENGGVVASETGQQ